MPSYDPARRLAQHNRRQHAYFESRTSPRMVPRRTAYVQRHVQEVLRTLALGQDDRVPEVGCGMGRYTLELACQGVAVEGLDLSRKLLDSLQAYNGGGYDIPVHCADVLDFAAETANRYAAVVGFFTLHHLHDLRLAFQAMARLLLPGGRTAFLEPNPFNPLFYIQIAATPGMTWQGDRGLVHMRTSEVFRAMASARFCARGVRRLGFFPPFLANRPWGPALEAHLDHVPLWRPLLPFQLFHARVPSYA